MTTDDLELGAHARRKLSLRFLLPLVLLIIACGSEDAPPEQSESTLPVEHTRLVVAVTRSTDAVREAGDPWARQEGVELEVVDPADERARDASLVERRGPGEEAWLLEPRGLLVRYDALEAAGREPRPPADWVEFSALVADLAREGGGLGLPSEVEGLHELLLPLIWSAQPDSVASGAESALDAPEAEEALAFLVQLAQYALRLPSEEVDEAFLSGQIALLPCGLEQAHRLRASMPSLALGFWAWPAGPDRGGARAFAELHSLELPPGAPHAELARSLARELAGDEAVGLLARAGSGCVSARPDSRLESPLLSPRYRDSLRPWPLDPIEEREAAILDAVCDAALDLRRSPAAALAEARRRGEP